VKRLKLGEMLIQGGLISESQLLKGLERQKTWGGRLGSNLVMIGALKEETLLKFLAEQTGVKEIILSDVEIAPSILKKIPQKVVEQFNMIPVYMEDKSTLIVALADPTDLNAIDQAAFITGHHIKPVITSYSAILQAINKYYLSTSNYTSANQEILMDVPKPPKKEVGFVADNMERHGGRSAVADPDLILFGDQTADNPADLSPPGGLNPLPEPTAAQPEPELNSDLINLNFEDDPQPSQPKRMPSNSSLESFSMEQRLIGMYHLLLKKRIITEAEISEELTRLWSLGKL